MEISFSPFFILHTYYNIDFLKSQGFFWFFLCRCPEPVARPRVDVFLYHYYLGLIFQTASLFSFPLMIIVYQNFCESASLSFYKICGSCLKIAAGGSSRDKTKPEVSSTSGAASFFFFQG
jgi:hypothetical protein